MDVKIQKISDPLSKRLFVCELCYSPFTRKHNLKRHLSRAHPTDDQREDFACSECGKIISRKDGLIRHIRSHSKNGEIFECATCHQNLISKRQLLSHIQKKHGLILDGDYLAKCSYCPFKSLYKRNVIRHIQKIHSGSNGGQSTKKVSRVKCIMCSMDFPTSQILYDHYSQYHNIKLEIEYLVFDSMEEFEQWKSPHYTHHTKWETSAEIVQKFRCHRSGIYEDTCEKYGRKRRRHLKLAGSKRLQGLCPGEISLRQKKHDGSCIVMHQKNHVGHDINDPEELQHIYLPKERGGKTITNPFRPKVCTKLKILRRRHYEMERQIEKQSFTIDYNAADETWLVPSFSNISDGIVEIYSVQELDVKECALSLEQCQFFCDLCNSCIHQYSCSCQDCSISKNMCVHIHTLALFRHNGELSQYDATVLPQEESVQTVGYLRDSTVSIDDEKLIGDEENDSEKRLGNFYEMIRKDLVNVFEDAKILVTRENIEDMEDYYRVFRQNIRSIKPTFEALQKNRSSVEINPDESVFQPSDLS